MKKITAVLSKGDKDTNNNLILISDDYPLGSRLIPLEVEEFVAIYNLIVEGLKNQLPVIEINDDTQTPVS